MRNAAKKSQAPVAGAPVAADDETAAEGQDGAPMQGGSPGVPLATSGAQLNPTTIVTHAASMVRGDARDPASEDAPPPKRYTVVGGPYRVMHQNMQYTLNHGRELSEHTHNIATLKKQGVRLQLVAEEEVAPQLAAG